MNEEEKKAIEYFKNELKEHWIESNFTISDRQNLRIILNLIEKLQKELNQEKEKNSKYIVNLTDEQYRKLVETIRNEINKELHIGEITTEDRLTINKLIKAVKQLNREIVEEEQ